MVPFRVYDAQQKAVWIVLNYHNGSEKFPSGRYLLAREDDSDKDGEMRLVDADQMAEFRLIDFLEEADNLN